MTCAAVPNAQMGTWRCSNLYLPFHSLLEVMIYPGSLGTGSDGAFRCQCSGDSAVCPSAVWQRQLIRSVIRVLAVITCTGSACSVLGAHEQVMDSPTCLPLFHLVQGVGWSVNEHTGKQGKAWCNIRGMLKESDKDVHAADWLDVHYWPLDMEDLLM